MLTNTELEGLRTRRDEIRRALATIGDLRPGSLFERYRRCGKPGCHCARPDAPGHGPRWVVTARVGGRPLTRSIPEGAVARTRAQIAECGRLRELTAELIEVSERLCQERLERDLPEPSAKRGRSNPRSRRSSSPRRRG